jgi:hypothetical protein
MNIITSNPIIEEADFHEEDWYNLFGEAAQRRRQTRKSTRQRNKARRQSSKQRSGGTFLQKVGRGIQGISDSGILNTISGMGRQGGQNMNVGMADMNDMNDMGFVPPPPPPPPPPREGMSTGAKVAIGVVIAAAVGVGIYFVAKKMKAKK